jgi:hypothetical protein
MRLRTLKRLLICNILLYCVELRSGCKLCFFQHSILWPVCKWSNKYKHCFEVSSYLKSFMVEWTEGPCPSQPFVEYFLCSISSFPYLLSWTCIVLFTCLLWFSADQCYLLQVPFCPGFIFICVVFALQLMVF